MPIRSESEKLQTGGAASWASRLFASALGKAARSPVAFEPETIKLMDEAFGHAKAARVQFPERSFRSTWQTASLEPPTGANVT
jgi:hypothetical protein